MKHGIAGHKLFVVCCHFLFNFFWIVFEHLTSNVHSITMNDISVCWWQSSSFITQFGLIYQWTVLHMMKERSLSVPKLAKLMTFTGRNANSHVTAAGGKMCLCCPSTLGWTKESKWKDRDREKDNKVASLGILRLEQNRWGTRSLLLRETKM